MAFAFQKEDRSLIAHLQGEVDHHSARSLMTTLEEAVQRELPAQLVIDAAGLQFMDSSGIALFLRAQRQMQSLDGSLIVRNLPAQGKKVYIAAGLDRLITLV